MAYGTDGAISALDLHLLEDTKHAQMVYEPCPVVRQPVLDAYPAIPGLLNPAFAALDGATLRQLNAKIAVDGQEVDAVATGWLKEKGLLKS
jgi:osmoprotectant transport system substrate-binding protein